MPWFVAGPPHCGGQVSQWGEESKWRAGETEAGENLGDWQRPEGPVCWQRTRESGAESCVTASQRHWCTTGSWGCSQWPAGTGNPRHVHPHAAGPACRRRDSNHMDNYAWRKSGALVCPLSFREKAQRCLPNTPLPPHYQSLAWRY
jgi:hypothetical protein